MEECRQEAMGHLKAAREEPEPSESESIKKGYKDDEGEPAGMTSPAQRLWQVTSHGR